MIVKQRIWTEDEIDVFGELDELYHYHAYYTLQHEWLVSSLVLL
jgi:hypothetical protein